MKEEKKKRKERCVQIFSKPPRSAEYRRPAAHHPQMVPTPGVLDPADPRARSLQLLLQTHTKMARSSCANALTKKSSRRSMLQTHTHTHSPQHTSARIGSTYHVVRTHTKTLARSGRRVKPAIDGDAEPHARTQHICSTASCGLALHSAAPMSSHAQQAAQDNLGASSLQAAPLNVGDCVSSTELLRDAAERVMLSQGRAMVSDQRATGEKMDDAPPIAREDERAESEQSPRTLPPHPLRNTKRVRHRGY